MLVRGETMVFFHGVLSVISLWLETIISLFPCCLLFAQCVCGTFYVPFHRHSDSGNFGKSSQEAFGINTKRVYARQVIFVIA